MEDYQIVELYNQRNEMALEQSQKKYGTYCFVIAKNILKSDEDSEECVNDTWVAAWNRIPPAIPKCLRAFLGRITRNISIDRYYTDRCSKRGGGEIKLALDELENCLADSSDVESEYLGKELSDCINAFLHTLPERDCDIFICRYYFMYSATDIAEKTGLTQEYIRTVLSRTRRKLKLYLEKEKYL